MSSILIETMDFPLHPGSVREYRGHAHSGAHFDGRVKRAILDAITEDYKPKPPVQHVKDGKPLTAIGAKLLGVEWKPQES